MLIDYDDSDDYRDDDCNDDCNDDSDGGSDPRRLFAESPKNPSRQEVHLGIQSSGTDSKSIMSKNSITRQKSIICQK